MVPKLPKLKVIRDAFGLFNGVEKYENGQNRKKTRG